MAKMSNSPFKILEKRSPEDSSEPSGKRQRSVYFEIPSSDSSESSTLLKQGSTDYTRIMSIKDYELFLICILKFYAKHVGLSDEDARSWAAAKELDVALKIMFKYFVSHNIFTPEQCKCIATKIGYLKMIPRLESNDIFGKSKASESPVKTYTETSYTVPKFDEEKSISQFRRDIYHDIQTMKESHALEMARLRKEYDIKINQLNRRLDSLATKVTTLYSMIEHETTPVYHGSHDEYTGIDLLKHAVDRF